ncbi:Transposase and inactivated derivatives [Mycobacteroides abscessus subsp. abscessus]|nr:Transposase and inactivated derivatives [Mycobacteroides abscessus subsp. abscessus]
MLDHLLAIDTSLKESYEVYQELLASFEAKDSLRFFTQMEQLPTTLDHSFKKAILYLTKHKQAISNALTYPYSNGKLEGKNNLIKVMKRMAFGFRTFRHLRRRILIQQNLCKII